MCTAHSHKSCARLGNIPTHQHQREHTTQPHATPHRTTTLMLMHNILKGPHAPTKQSTNLILSTQQCTRARRRACVRSQITKVHSARECRARPCPAPTKCDVCVQRTRRRRGRWGEGVCDVHEHVPVRVQYFTKFHSIHTNIYTYAYYMYKGRESIVYSRKCDETWCVWRSVFGVPNNASVARYLGARRARAVRQHIVCVSVC